MEGDGLAGVAKVVEREWPGLRPGLGWGFAPDPTGAPPLVPTGAPPQTPRGGGCALLFTSHFIKMTSR